MNSDNPISYKTIPEGFSALEVKKVGAHAYELLSDFVNPYQIVPKGFTFNGASVPRVLWFYLDPAGEAFEAACIHDYLYQTTLKTKEDADRIFRDVLMLYGVRKSKACAAYRSVKRFGKGNYK